MVHLHLLKVWGSFFYAKFLAVFAENSSAQPEHRNIKSVERKGSYFVHTI